MSVRAISGQTAVVNMPFSRTEVFALLADIEQLPRWAPRMFHGLAVGRDGWAAYTPWGELKLELSADAATGFVYIEVRTGRKTRGVFSFWVAAGKGGGTRVLLVSFPECETFGTDEVLDALYTGLQGDLPRLGKVLEAGWKRPGKIVGCGQSAA